MSITNIILALLAIQYCSMAAVQMAAWLSPVEHRMLDWVGMTLIGWAAVWSAGGLWYSYHLSNTGESGWAHLLMFSLGAANLVAAYEVHLLASYREKIAARRVARERR